MRSVKRPNHLTVQALDQALDQATVQAAVQAAVQATVQTIDPTVFGSDGSAPKRAQNGSRLYLAHDFVKQEKDDAVYGPSNT
jgi:hypothetical protein